MYWPASVPVRAMLATLSGAPPLLAIAMFCAALVVVVGVPGKARLVGDGVAVGGVRPVPERLTTCVVGVASSVIVSVAVKGFAVAGVNVTAMVQVLPGEVELIAAPAMQVVPAPLTMAKSVGFVPPNTTVPILSVALPLLVTVMVCAALVVV